MLGEKKQDDTPMKTLPEADEEDLVKTNGETEPLVAVTPTGNNDDEDRMHPHRTKKIYNYTFIKS